MTMKIEVTIPVEAVQGGGAAEYLTHAMSAIGFSRGFVRYDQEIKVDDLRRATAFAANERMSDDDAARQVTEAVTATEAMTAEGRAAAERGELTAENALPPKRERGKPAPGRARRTKEEIAEDEAAEKAEASAPVADAPLISTGEERIDPTTAEDAAQDAADEAAEVAATPAKDLTHDDVRAALQRYVAAYGMPAAMEDGPKVFGMIFGQGVAKVSDIPTDQAALAKAIAGVEEMLAKNPFARAENL